METQDQASNDAEHRAIVLATHIPPDNFQDTLIEFVKNSSLAYCTTLDTRADDSIAVVPDWSPDTFSTGEKYLWGLLRSLCDGDLRGLADKGNVGNRIALVAVVSELMGARR